MNGQYVINSHDIYNQHICCISSVISTDVAITESTNGFKYFILNILILNI